MVISEGDRCDSDRSDSVGCDSVNCIQLMIGLIGQIQAGLRPHPLTHPLTVSVA